MAVVAVTFDGVRIDAADAAGNWDDLDSTKTSVVNNDFFFQGAGSIGFKVLSTKTGGMEYEAASAVDYEATKRVVLFKGLVTTPGILRPFGEFAERFRVGSDQTNYWRYWIRGGPTSGPGLPTYPNTASWLFTPIDPDVTGHRTVVVGTPVMTAVDYYAHAGRMTASPIDQNFATDALDYVTSGTGLTLIGGDSTDPDGTFADFVLEDEGDVANRWGVIRTIPTTPNVMIAVGVLTIGTATATVFTDGNVTVIWQDGRTRAGWCGLDVNLASATTVVTLSSITFLGAGRTAIKKFFDTALQVNGSTEVITMLGHGLEIGDGVTYSREGGSDDIGPEPGEFFVDVLTVDTFTLHTTKIDAFNAASAVDLTAASAPGENHSIILANDTQPDHEITNTSGSYAASLCIYDAHRIITLTAAVTITGGLVLRTKTVVISTGTLDGVSVSLAATEEGEALLDPVTTVANISDCTFTAGVEGHGIRQSTTTSATFSGNTLTGYWAPAAGGWNFDTITGVDAGTDIITTAAAHGFATGEAVFYNDEGGSDTIGLTDLAKYYVRVLSSTTVTVHLTRAAAVANSSIINLSDGSTGETHSLYSGRAFFFNDGGGSATITISNGGTAPSVRNGAGASTTIVTAPVTTTLTVNDDTDSPEVNAQTLLEAADGTGDLPFDVTVTITSVTTTATVSHSAHGLVTGDKVVIRGAVEQPYNGVFTVTVTTANEYTYTFAGAGSPATGTIKATGVVVAGLTDGSGIVTATRAYSVDQNLKGTVRKATTTPFFKDINFTDVVDSAAGLTKIVQFQLDE